MHINASVAWSGAKAWFKIWSWAKQIRLLTWRLDVHTLLRDWHVSVLLKTNRGLLGKVKIEPVIPKKKLSGLVSVSSVLSSFLSGLSEMCESQTVSHQHSCRDSSTWNLMEITCLECLCFFYSSICCQNLTLWVISSNQSIRHSFQYLFVHYNLFQKMQMTWRTVIVSTIQYLFFEWIFLNLCFC